MAHDVFISYSAKDKPTADAVCATLEGKGIRCWVAPRDVLPGMDWSEAIIDGINQSRVMVLVYSASANQSPQIKREVERAVSKGMAVLPLRLEDVPMSKSLEYFISSPHWLDALTPPLERHLDYLAETLKLLLARNGGLLDQQDLEAAPEPNRPATRPQPAAAPPPPSPSAVVARDAAMPAVVSPSPQPAGAATGALRQLNAGHRNIGLLAGGALAVLVIGFGLYALLGARNASLEPELVGAWTATVQTGGTTWDWTTTIDDKGSCQIEIATKDAGTFDARNGRWRTVSERQEPTEGTYAFQSTDSVSMVGPTGTAVWTRKPGTSARSATRSQPRNQPAVPDEIARLDKFNIGRKVFDAFTPRPDSRSSRPADPRESRFPGEWHSALTRNGLNWRSTFEVTSDWRYRFGARSEVSGLFETDGGKWRIVSGSQPPLEGTYQILNRDSISIAGPLGATMWTRRRQG